jgi:hypothetical protein
VPFRSGARVIFENALKVRAYNLFVLMTHLICSAIVTLIALPSKLSSLLTAFGHTIPFGDVGMPKTETLNLRVSPDFKQRLIEEATKERRSVTNYLETTMLAYWERTDTSSGKEKGKKK